MRRQISSKSNTCTESTYVYAAGIGVKVRAHYPGRSANLPECYRDREVAGWVGRRQQRPY